MKLAYFLILFGSISFLSCNSSSVDNQSHAQINDSLFTEVIAIHDLVMPKMGELQKLKAMVDSIGASKEENEKAIYETISNQLVESDKAMMSWMHDFDAEKAQGTSEETRMYLESEMRKVTAMKDLFLSSMENAEQIIKGDE